MTWPQVLFLAVVILAAAVMIMYGPIHYRWLALAVSRLANAAESINFKTAEQNARRESQEKITILQSWEVDVIKASHVQVLYCRDGHDLQETVAEYLEDDLMTYKPLRVELVEAEGKVSHIRVFFALFEKPPEQENVEGQWCAGAVKETI